MLSFFPRDVLDGNLNLIESVSEGFLPILPDAINCFIKLFADDAKIYAQVNSIEQAKDLQE